VIKSRVGGRLMDKYMLSLLEKNGSQVRPLCSIKKTVSQDQVLQVGVVVAVVIVGSKGSK